MRLPQSNFHTGWLCVTPVTFKLLGAIYGAPYNPCWCATMELLLSLHSDTTLTPFVKRSRKWCIGTGEPGWMLLANFTMCFSTWELLTLEPRVLGGKAVILAVCMGGLESGTMGMNREPSLESGTGLYDASITKPYLANQTTCCQFVLGDRLETRVIFKNTERVKYKYWLSWL